MHNRNRGRTRRFASAHSAGRAVMYNWWCICLDPDQGWHHSVPGCGLISILAK